MTPDTLGKTTPKVYWGTKQILAWPMTRQAYIDYRGWQLPADENGADEGFLVEYLDGYRPNHPHHIGYISWSPKAVFEDAYQDQSAGLTFGHAIEAMKRGAKVARAGWNGKDMWVALSNTPVACRSVSADGFWSKHGRDFAMSQGGWAQVLPCFLMKTADNKILQGWLASQTDMVAEDWIVITEPMSNTEAGQ